MICIVITDCCWLVFCWWLFLVFGFVLFVGGFGLLFALLVVGFVCCVC